MCLLYTATFQFSHVISPYLQLQFTFYGEIPDYVFSFDDLNKYDRYKVNSLQEVNKHVGRSYWPSDLGCH